LSGSESYFSNRPDPNSTSDKFCANILQLESFAQY
jgi:hypothetical protein